MGVWRVDLQSGVALVDDQWKQLFGLTHRPGYEFSIAEVDGLVHANDRPALEAARREAEQGGLFRSEFRVRMPDGHWRWIAGVGELLDGDGEGRFRQAIGVNYDVTDRVEAARRAAFRMDLTMQLNEVDRPAQVQRLAAELLGGHLEAECVGYSELDEGLRQAKIACDWTAPGFTSVVGDHQLAMFGPEVMAPLRSHRTVRIDDIASHPGAGAYQAAYQALGVRAAVAAPVVSDKKVVACLFVLSAVPRCWTEAEISLIEEVAQRTRGSLLRTAADQALKASEQRLHVAAEAIRGIIYECDISSGLVERSQGLRTLTGFDVTEAEATVAWWRERIHPDDQARLQGVVERLKHEGGDLAVDYRIRHRDGHWVHVWDQAKLLPARANEPARLIGCTVDISDQKRALRALTDSEARLRAAQEAARIGIYDWDIAVDRIDWDATTRALWGVSPDQPINYTVFRAGLHPDDVAATEAVVAGALDPQGSGVYDAEYRVINKADGRVRWVHASGRVRFSKGKPQRLIGAVYDVTSRREAEDRLKAVLDQLFAFVGVLAIDGTVLFVNRAPLDLAGLKREDVIGRHFADCYWWSYAAHIQDQLRDSIERARKGGIVRSDVWVRMEGGRLIPIDFQIAPLRDSSGTIVGLIPSGIDIAQRQEAQQQLKDSERRFRATFANAAVGIAHIGLQGEWLRVNPRMCEILGYPPEELARRTFLDLTHPADIHADMHQFEQLKRGELEGYKIEKRYFRKEGTLIWAQLTASLQRAEDGSPLYCISVVEDITERKRAEEVRALMVDELNHRVKNTLAIVQGLAAQSFRGIADAGPALAAFDGRLHALSTAHDLLTRESWKSADLSEVARDTLTAQGVDLARLVLDGPPVMLAPKQAVSIAMALHELATNAVKYGALSVPGGRVELVWHCNGGLTLRWQEIGGPPVKPPARRGFGTRMIEKALAYELGGTVQLDFASAGVCCTIQAPITETTEANI